jgi:hypothetical protein
MVNNFLQQDGHVLFHPFSENIVGAFLYKLKDSIVVSFFNALQWSCVRFLPVFTENLVAAFLF